MAYPYESSFASILTRKGLKPAVVERLESEGFDESTFKAATPDVLRAVGFKGAEILSIVALQKDSSIFTAGNEPKSPVAPSVQNARVLRSNSASGSECGSPASTPRKSARTVKFQTPISVRKAVGPVGPVGPGCQASPHSQGSSSQDANPSSVGPVEPEPTPSTQSRGSLLLGTRLKPGCQPPRPHSQGSSSRDNLVSVLVQSLPQFDVVKILSERLATKAEDRDIINKLRNNILLPQRHRKRVIRILTQFLHEQHVSDPKDVTTHMKEGMAMSFVNAFPVYKMECGDENSKPWHHVYSPQSSGWIANASRPFQRRNRKRKTKQAETELSGDELMEDDAIEQMAELMPGRQEKGQILDGMAASFTTRSKDRKSGMTIQRMLEKYPHLKHYDGEVLKEEFRRLYPRAEDMCRAFTKLLPKILSLPERREISLALNEDIMKALVLLSHQLPHDIPMPSDGNVSHSWALVEDVVNVVQLNQDIDEYISSKREQAARPVQPYLLLVQSPLTNKTLRTFLILDNSGVQLPSNSFLKSFDWLFRSYFVFNVRYPFGWRNTFHFLQICLYKIRENCGKPDRMNSSEFELWKTLSQS